MLIEMMTESTEEIFFCFILLSVQVNLSVNKEKDDKQTGLI